MSVEQPTHPSGRDLRRRAAFDPVRARVLTLLFGVVAVVLISRASLYAVFRRGELLNEMRHQCLCVYRVPAARGRILDAAGVPLAWSVRRYDLCWDAPQSADIRKADLKAFRQAFPRALRTRAQASFDAAGRYVLLPRLQGKDLETAYELCRSHPRFHVRTTFERRVRPGLDPTLRQRLGRVVVVAGQEHGLDGEERRFDDILRGKPGVFTVAIDKYGRWIPQTWQKLQEMQPGYDVYLPVRIGR